MKSNLLLAAVCAAAAMGLGILAGYVDLHQHEPQPAALAIVASTFAVTVVAGARPWLYGSIGGLGIFLVHFSTRMVGMPVAPDVQLPWTLLALVPGLAGAYAGSGLRKIVAVALRSL